MLPGRLGDPSMCIATDPRADPRLVAFLAPLGVDQPAPEGPVDEHSSYEELLAFQSAGEQGFAGLIAYAYTDAPPIEGVERTTETITGVDGNTITLFIHRPEGVTDPVPGLLHLHGGGMSIGVASDTQFEYWRDSLAASGLVVVGVEFRNSAGVLGPHPFPAGLNDCSSALDWMHANRQRLGVSTLVVSGESGGANLALATTIKAKRDGRLAQIDGVYVGCPNISGNYRNPPDELVSLRENDGYFLGVTLMATSARVYDYDQLHTTNPLAWPYHATIDDLTGMPPHMISVNEIDPLRDEGIAYHRKLLAAGSPSITRLLLGTTHSADQIFYGAFPDVYASNIREIAGFAQAL